MWAMSTQASIILADGGWPHVAINSILSKHSFLSYFQIIDTKEKQTAAEDIQQGSVREACPPYPLDKEAKATPTVLKCLEFKEGALCQIICAKEWVGGAFEREMKGESFSLPSFKRKHLYGLMGI